FRLQRRPSGLSTTKPGTLLKSQVPVHTYTLWDEQRPGFVELDLVAHCEPSTAGFYLNTLTVTDVASGWTECQGVWGKGQAAVFAALETIRTRLPMPLLGLDADNGSEFLNAHLVRWCAQEQITFTRSRPYWKNDQAHVEQKNWSQVRRLLGYDRYESEAALEALNAVYQQLRLWTNHWQPVLKLVGKERDGAQVTKRYDTAQTPYQRLLAWEGLGASDRARLVAEHALTRPRATWQALEAARQQLWRLDARRAPTGPTTATAQPATG